MLADRREPEPALYQALVLAGWLTLLMPLTRRAILPAAVPLGVRGGSLAAALALVAPPLVLLGMIAPLAAKAAVTALGELGAGVGGLYALSTVGSLAGALATGFLLIPLLGVVRILDCAAGLLLLPALAYWAGAPRQAGRRLWLAVAAAGLAAAAYGATRPDRGPVSNAADHWEMLHRADSAYGEVKVVQYGGTRRVLLLDGTMQTGVDIATRSPLFYYAAAAESLVAAARPPGKRALLIGFGGGVMADRLAQMGYDVESVEIDPVVEDAARRFFVRDRPLVVRREDGRTFLAHAAPAAYDLVVLDAYAGDTPPSHLFTVEAYRLVRRALAPGGVGLCNMIATSGGPAVQSVGRTLGAVFPWVAAWTVDPGAGATTNVLYLFSDRSRAINVLPPVKAHPQITAYLRDFVRRRVAFTGIGALVFTDDYNPVESMNLSAREHMRDNLRQLLPAWLLLE
jgi:spermidine synthase